ncbi:hypothetical protein OE88DRAFT_743131 [Heliocybe sulcata]|uniref:Uncharacterized protein n=1 Tax=Heliocybe sulcata TaxID=5364 RepID=A0A5C3MRX8_9AGAM|nr:hypothetical protein OE88DRAFT_743131 [Heliocybe sulcata]
MASAKSQKRALSSAKDNSPKGKKTKAAGKEEDGAGGKELKVVEEAEPSKKEATPEKTPDGQDLLRYPLKALPDPVVFYSWAEAASSLISGDGYESPVFNLKSQIVDAYKKKKQQEKEGEDEESCWYDGVVSYDGAGEEGEVEVEEEEEEEGEEEKGEAGQCRKLLLKEYERKSKEADEMVKEMKEKEGIDQYGWWWEFTFTRAEPEGIVPKMKVTFMRPHGLTEKDEDESATLWVKDVKVADAEGHRMMSGIVDYIAEW